MMLSERSRWHRVRKVLISLFLLCGAVTAVVLVARMPAAVVEVPREEVLPVSVEVLEIKPMSQMVDVLQLPGAVEPNQIVDVPVEQRGRIERIHVREGDIVKEGDLLLELDATLLRTELNRARAQADFDERMVVRSRELLERGVTNRSELEELEARFVYSQASLDVARTNLERTEVRAPTSGVLNDLVRDEGEYVSEGDTVAQIVDVELVKVAVEVPERDIRFMRKGQVISLRVDALDGRRFAGQVSFISEVADPATRSTRVEITLDNSTGVLHAGMIVRTEIVRRTLQNVILIPLAAVIPLEVGHVVYLASNGEAERREVSLGAIRGTQVQVLEGLEPGDLLIVKGNRLVGPGQLIEVTAGS